MMLTVAQVAAGEIEEEIERVHVANQERVRLADEQGRDGTLQGAADHRGDQIVERVVDGMLPVKRHR